MGKEFGAFNGVFIPTFLSIIGVILFLRLGVVVGTAGLLGTIIIILLAVSVTIATGLALSSVTTNIRIGNGGAYSIITKTLGLEVGGSVGIPLYLAQIFSVALYIFGFVEAWQFIFPEHPKVYVLAITFFILLTLIIISTEIAVKAQSLVFFFVILSLISVFLGTQWTAGIHLPMGGDTTQFWQLFALFFPATTGLMAGIGLSGRLSDPKRQIPLGVISALIITTIIYLGATFWFANVATVQELSTQPDIVVTRSAFPALVLLGILAATFSSALTTLVAAPQLLSAMGDNGVLVANKFLAKKHKGEPRNAILITIIAITILLALGSLDIIAPILTMFFLITYGMINLAVYLENSLGSVSFRPTLKIPKYIPLYGVIGSVIFMFMINPYVAVSATIILFIIYFILAKRNLKPKQGDARSGLISSIAKWAAQTINKLPEGSKHNWKPSVLLPVITTSTLLGNFPVIRSIAYPNGTMTVLGLRLTTKTKTPIEITKKQHERELSELPSLVKKFGAEHIFTNQSIVEVKNYTDGICIALESIKSQVLSPNLLFLSFSPRDMPKYDIKKIFLAAQQSNVGVLMLDRDEELGLGSEEDIHVWISDDILKKDFYDNNRPFDLALIMAYRLYSNWDGKLHIWMTTTARRKRKAQAYLQKLIYEARFPQTTIKHIITKPLHDALVEAPHGDLHIVPIELRDLDEISRFRLHKGKTFMFVSDSINEDILA